MLQKGGVPPPGGGADMAQVPEQKLEDLLTADKARSLKANAGSIQKLADSADGKKVRKLLGDEQRAAKALETGDAAELRKIMERVLSSEEGKRLAGQLKDLLG